MRAESHQVCKVLHTRKMGDSLATSLLQLALWTASPRSSAGTGGSSLGWSRLASAASSEGVSSNLPSPLPADVHTLAFPGSFGGPFYLLGSACEPVGDVCPGPHPPPILDQGRGSWRRRTPLRAPSLCRREPLRLTLQIGRTPPTALPAYPPEGPVT